MNHRLLTVNNEDDLALLRRRAKPVKNITDPKVTVAIQTMKRIAFDWEQSTGRKCDGLAATQVGIYMRILLARNNDMVAPLKPREDDFTSDVKAAEAAMTEYKEWMRVHGATYDPWYVVINPVIVKCEDFFEMEEGCLSIPGKVIKTVRPKMTLFHYWDVTGKHVGSFSNPLVAKMQSSAVLVHETDHLNGVLAIDNALSVRDESPEDHGISL